MEDHRYGIYDRRDGLKAEADTEDAARLAIRTLAGDEAEAGLPVESLGIWDSETLTWIIWPWGCPGCGRVGGPSFCGDCRLDRSLGERLGTTRREEEEAIRPDRHEAQVEAPWTS